MIKAAMKASWGMETDPYSRIRARFSKASAPRAARPRPEPRSAALRSWLIPVEGAHHEPA